MCFLRIDLFSCFPKKIQIRLRQRHCWSHGMSKWKFCDIVRTTLYQVTTVLILQFVYWLYKINRIRLKAVPHVNKDSVILKTWYYKVARTNDAKTHDSIYFFIQKHKKIHTTFSHKSIINRDIHTVTNISKTSESLLENQRLRGSSSVRLPKSWAWKESNSACCPSWSSSRGAYVVSRSVYSDGGEKCGGFDWEEG